MRRQHPELVEQAHVTFGYDALGRRVWQRAIFGNGCPFYDASSPCSSSYTNAVWDGNQLLIEDRGVADTGYISPVIDRGAVVYVHGGEVDKPLAVLRIGGGHDVLPVTNWHGIITDGGCPTAECNSADVTFAQYAAAIMGAPGYPKLSPNYYGSLIQGQQDPTGYIYQRNRYLDPNTGRFTQEDPIGLAGGLNVYGYANGDPVNYSDPFGLCPCGVHAQAAVVATGLGEVGEGSSVAIAGTEGGIAGIAIAGGILIFNYHVASVPVPQHARSGALVGADMTAVRTVPAASASVVPMATAGQRIRSLLAGIALGVGLRLGGTETGDGISEEQEKAKNNRQREEQTQDDKTKQGGGQGGGGGNGSSGG